jgi:glycogen debranching enzyme
MPWLLKIGQVGIVRTHLENLSECQRPNGQIPILFLDRTLPFLADKAKKSFHDGKISFMLKRYFAGELWNLTPGTKDSEILYIIAMHEYANQTRDRSLLFTYRKHLQKALDYIENNLMKDGLATGCDWRDTMERELGERSLLTNNSLLYRAYSLMGMARKATELRNRINEKFWTGNSYIDYEGNNRFDPLGGAFAVLYGIAPEERYKSLIKRFSSVDTKHGITIKCRHNPFKGAEKEIIERTDGVVVWPFVAGFSVLALLKMGERAMAEDQFRKLSELGGFREWYDPATGNGYGATKQLWSAILFLRAQEALKQ